MKTIVLGAGIIGISTAWHLLERGHEVTVVDRQPGPALETSFANAGQISVSYCEPWANAAAPWKALKWMFDKEAPLLFRPQLDMDQWRWSLKFLAQCNDKAFARNVQQLVALGAYSHSALKDIVASTGVEFNRLERGIAHFYSDRKAYNDAAVAVDLMRQYGVERRLVTREELLTIEPAFAAYRAHMVGGTFTSSDESGDAFLFTQRLAERCAARGAQLLYGHEVQALQREEGTRNNAIKKVAISARPSSAGGQIDQILEGDAIVVACGAYSAPLLRSVGVDLPIYPGKGYSATFRVLRPELAPTVSLLDDGRKIAISRLGDHVRVAGTIELGGFDLSLDTPVARARCHMLSNRVEELFPGACDTRTKEQGGNPNYWTGLRPGTPTNIPFIGKTGVPGLWVNAGHGTLGWTHGAGSGRALAELMSGERPGMDFRFNRET